jgi:hypothetical protein
MRFYSCGHTSRLIQRSVTEPPIEVKDEVSWIKKLDPVGAITRARDSKITMMHSLWHAPSFRTMEKKLCHGTRKKPEIK